MRGDEDKEVDIYRDTVLRYMGYCNEVGEAFRPVTPPAFVISTYVLSISYVIADSYDKAMKAHKKYEKQGERVQRANVAVEGLDCMLWQGAASVVIPGLLIHRAVYAMRTLTYNAPQPLVRKFAPTVFGLSLIPFIIHPLDNFVHWGMDNTTRPAMAKMKESYTETPAAAMPEKVNKSAGNESTGPIPQAKPPKIVPSDVAPHPLKQIGNSTESALLPAETKAPSTPVPSPPVTGGSEQAPLCGPSCKAGMGILSVAAVGIAFWKSSGK